MAKNVNSSKYRNIYQAKTTHLESRIDSKVSGLVAILKEDKLFPSSTLETQIQDQASCLCLYLDIALEMGAETLLLNSVIWSLLLFFFLPMLNKKDARLKADLAVNHSLSNKTVLQQLGCSGSLLRFSNKTFLYKKFCTLRHLLGYLWVVFVKSHFKHCRLWGS